MIENVNLTKNLVGFKLTYTNAVNTSNACHNTCRKTAATNSGLDFLK